MNNRKRKEAIRETFAFSGEMFESERNQQSGLRLKTTRMSRTCGLSRIGGNGYLCAMMLKPSRMRRRRLGGLLKQRRMTAAPCFSKARGVSFKVSTFPGVDAPSSVIRHPGRIAPSEFVMGAPGGELSSSPLPLLRSANLPGVAHLLAEVSGFSNPNRGNSAMNKHEAVNAPARALNLGLCKVLNLINCFTGKAGYVQPLGSYPATGPGMRLPSIWKVNPELLELARVEANRAAASMEVRHA